MEKKRIKKVVIKVGSSLIANYKSGLPKKSWINSFINDLVFLLKKKIKIIIVSSGAIAIGRKRVGFFKKKLNLDEQQAAASVGQIYLINNYKKAFNKKKVEISQVLLTLEDTIKKEKKLNAKKTLNKLIEKNIVPIINENDTVATDEIKFGDNDRLSARVAEIVKADLLILLSDVSGLYNKDPKTNKKAKLIEEVKTINKSIIRASSFTNNHFAKGGMKTKIMAAKIATNAGCGMIIVNGNSKKIVQKIFEGKEGTYFHPKKRKKNS
tara:strand:+ start:245 stop:1045 length:801 start_codon:yes stop_codon:yes gene_type:complete